MKHITYILIIVSLVISNLSMMNSFFSVRNSFYKVKVAYEEAIDRYPKGGWMAQKDVEAYLKANNDFYEKIIAAQRVYIEKMEEKISPVTLTPCKEAQILGVVVQPAGKDRAEELFFPFPKKLNDDTRVSELFK